jgi:hypothetical protein
MTPFLPCELLAGGWELVCCGCTIVAAVMSYVLMLR